MILTIASNKADNINTVLTPNKSANIPISSEPTPKNPVPSANNHFKFTLPINSGVNKLDTNMADVMVKGTKDAAVADPVNTNITLIILTIYNTSPILASVCPDNNKEKFLFNVNNDRSPKDVNLKLFV